MGCKQCKGNSAVQADGSVLDRVISQSSNEDQCLLYKLANYKKGGELIDAYNMGGQAEVEKLIREQFGVLMYNEGKGQIINRAEYLRWKFRDHTHVVLPIEASLSRYDPLARWSDHPACWQMRHRGALGETLLHVLIICDTRVHTRLARTLIKCFPNLALDIVEGEEYLGASALHLAIAYFNNELVQDLVEAGANVNQRAIGSFFLPRDQQRPNPARHTDYEGLAYLGEYPLAWAACCANESVYNLLLDSEADPDLQDSFGNMILHMVVVCDKLDMFGYALRHPKLPASNGKLNTAGLTPLTLACKLGRAEVFREMLELSAREFWRYSNITCSAYPLNALDTLLPDGRTNWNSALFIILNGTKEEHLDMLDGGIIQRLLEEKWKTFARKQFLKRLLILFIHLVLLSMAVYLRPEDKSTPLLGSPENAQDAFRYACEIGTLIGVLSYVLLQQGDEVKNQGLVAFLKQLTHAPAKAIFLLSNFLILACIPYRLIGDRESEEAILVFAVPGSWFLLMFFAGAVRLTGPFVTMIYSMITGDMLTFGIIYSIVLFGFSQSFYFLYKGFPGVKNSLFGSYPSTWMALFQITLGDYSYSDLSFTTYPNLAKSVFALFMVFVPILLLNMLIAMMGNTYAHVIEQSEKEWMKQWAKIVVTLERAVPQADAHQYLQEYSIGLGPSDDPRYEQRGVMVIKSKSKTRAKQRKGAVANWKRVGKVTINELRKRGMTGEDLRRIMWGRASISTPTKAPLKPPVDPILQAGGQNLAVGFGEALTSALDVMAFTHNLDLTGANGLNLQSNNNALYSIAVPVTQNNLVSSMMKNGNVVSVSSAGVVNTNITSNSVPKPPGVMANNSFPVSQMQPTLQNQNQPGVTKTQGGMPVSQLGVQGTQSGLKLTIQPGMQTTQLGIQTMQSGLQTVTPGMQTAQPGMQTMTPGLQTTQIMQPGMQMTQQPIQLGMQTTQPGMQIMQPGLQTMQPGLQTMQPGVQSIQSGMQMAQPGTPTGIFIMQPGMQLVQPGSLQANNAVPMSPTVQAMNMINQQMQAGNQILVYSDPLREIVHLSDSKDSSEHEGKIKSLAVEAANLFHVQEVNPVIKPKPKTTNIAGTLNNLFGMEAPAGSQVDWNAGDKRIKKLSAMEPSDSEGLGEAPLLGKSARTKRARSATKRNINSTNNRGKPTSAISRRTARLALIGETSSSEVPPENAVDNLDEATERFHEIQNSLVNIHRNPTVVNETDISEVRRNLSLKELRPVNIEHAAGSHTSSTYHNATTVDVITEKAVIIKGEGSGMEVESGNSEQQSVRFQEKEPHSKERRKSEKKRTRHRPKTAKHNRVAPMLTVEDKPKHSRKRGKSANGSGKHRRHGEHQLEEPSSPPDPLENWSTAGIASMNSLLSNDNESDDY